MATIMNVTSLTVGELRSLLDAYNDDVPVVFEYDSNDYWGQKLFSAIEQVRMDDASWNDYHGEYAPAGEDDLEAGNYKPVVVLR